MTGRKTDLRMFAFLLLFQKYKNHELSNDSWLKLLGDPKVKSRKLKNELEEGFNYVG